MSAKHAANAEVVIVGGGPAGSAAAIPLARSGVDVLILERESKPVHKVCGEFLSEEAVDLLISLGVPISRFAAPVIQRLRVSREGRVLETTLPFHARSLSRRCLDEALLQEAGELGCRVRRGQYVNGIVCDGDSWRVLLRGGDVITTPQVMLATGKHDVAGHQRPQGQQSDLVGFKQHFRLQPSQRHALRNHVELHLFAGGYAGLQLVEDGSANFCCVTKAGSRGSVEARWQGLLEQAKRESSLLRERLCEAQPMYEKPLAIAPIPYGMVRQSTQEGLWLLGDQAAVIPSYTGDGMSMALHSGVLAASAMLAGSTSLAFQRAYAKAVRGQVRLATGVSQQLVRPAAQQVAMGVLQVFPGVLTALAKKTRLSSQTRRGALQAVEESLIPEASSCVRYGRFRV